MARVVLAPADDPRQETAAVYERQMDLLAQVRLAQTQISQARQRLQGPAHRLRTRLPRFEEEARAALAAGREDLAREALYRRRMAQAELDALSNRVAEVEEQQRRLQAVEDQLAGRLEAFRTQREVVRARSEAEARIDEALGQFSTDFAALGLELDEAQRRSERMVADASALDRLAGLLEATGGTALESEILRLRAQDGLDAELSRLKQNIESQASGPTGKRPARDRKE